MHLLEIRGVDRAVFKSRPNRFLVELADGRLVHLHDPGRLSELLVPGAKVLIKKIEDKSGKARKTEYDLLAVKYRNYWVFVHSGFHSQIAKKVVQKMFGQIRASEVKVGKSRIDFLLSDGRPLEVKGCTLMVGRTAFFPDAPTERGTKHVLEITKHKGVLLFLVFHPPAKELRPNCKTDPKFCNAMTLAKNSGVDMKAVKIRTRVNRNKLTLEAMTEIPVIVNSTN